MIARLIKIVKGLKNKTISENEAEGLLYDLLGIGRAFYYRFIFKDDNGNMAHITIKVSHQDNDLAIKTFECRHPKKVWRNFQEVKQFRN